MHVFYHYQHSYAVVLLCLNLWSLPLVFVFDMSENFLGKELVIRLKHVG